MFPRAVLQDRYKTDFPFGGKVSCLNDILKRQVIEDDKDYWTGKSEHALAG